MWVFSIYTMVDGFFVSKYVGESSLSAVNLALPFVNTLFAISILFATGTSTLVGIALGEKNYERAEELFNLTVAAELISSVLLSIFCSLFLEEIVYFLGTTTYLFKDVYTYLHIIVWFSPFFILSYHFEVLIKVDGFPKLATLGVVSSAVTNIVLDYLFVGVFDFGIAGAAWATGIAQMFSTLLFLYHFIFGNSKLNFKRTRWSFSTFPKIFSIGFGSFISEFSTGFTIFLYNHYILKILSQKALISYTVVSYINLFVFMTMVGLTQGMQPLVSYYYGKKEQAIYRKFLLFSVVGVAFLSLLFYGGSIFISDPVISLFISANEVSLFRDTKEALFWFAPSFLFIGFNTVISGYFASVGRAKEAFVISVARGFGFIWFALFITSLTKNPKLLWLSAFFSEVTTLLLALAILLPLLKRHPTPYREEAASRKI